MNMPLPFTPDPALKPEVHGFFDPATNTISYIVKDPGSDACAVIDSVMDFDQAAGRISFESADRLILSMLDACVECLNKSIVASADEVDAAMIFAPGFAPFRGGPMHYARQRGTTEIREKLNTFAEKHGPRFKPDLGWSKL